MAQPTTYRLSWCAGQQQFCEEVYGVVGKLAYRRNTACTHPHLPVSLCATTSRTRARGGCFFGSMAGLWYIEYELLAQESACADKDTSRPQQLAAADGPSSDTGTSFAGRRLLETGISLLEPAEALYMGALHSKGRAHPSGCAKAMLSACASEWYCQEIPIGPLSAGLMGGLNRWRTACCWTGSCGSTRRRSRPSTPPATACSVRWAQGPRVPAELKHPRVSATFLCCFDASQAWQLDLSMFSAATFSVQCSIISVTYEAAAIACSDIFRLPDVAFGGNLWMSVIRGVQL